MSGPTWVCVVYVGVALLGSFISGFVVPPTPTEDIKSEIPIIVWMWPLWAFIGTVSSPIWLPYVLRQAAKWIADKLAARKAVKDLLNGSRLPQNH